MTRHHVRLPSMTRWGLRALLGSLILIILLFPLFDDSLFGRGLLVVLSTAIALSGAYAASHDARRLRLALLLALPSVAGRWWSLFDESRLARGVGLVTSMAFFVYTIVLLLDRVLTTEESTGDELYGAVSIYILIGFVWALAYGGLDLVRPGAIQGTHGPLVPGDFIYFSFITLMTVGYGDMAPVHPAARALAMLEAMVGIIFVAVLIGRLVGLNTPPRR